jgi:hypothetical protein
VVLVVLLRQIMFMDRKAMDGVSNPHIDPRPHRTSPALLRPQFNITLFSTGTQTLEHSSLNFLPVPPRHPTIHITRYSTTDTAQP